MSFGYDRLLFVLVLLLVILLRVMLVTEIDAVVVTFALLVVILVGSGAVLACFLCGATSVLYISCYHGVSSTSSSLSLPKPPKGNDLSPHS